MNSDTTNPFSYIPTLGRDKPKPAIPTLKSGVMARWDTFSGLIPVRILKIKNEAPWRADPRPSSDYHVTARITRKTGPYRAGEIVHGWALSFVPPEALIKTQYDTRIGAYQVEADK